MAREIAERIRELRRAMRLTQSRFAELTDLSEDSIGKIERGAAVPTVATLRRIADALKMPLSELLGEAPAKGKGRNKAVEDLVKYLQTKPYEDVRLIHEIAVKVLERKPPVKQC